MLPCIVELFRLFLYSTYTKSIDRGLWRGTLCVFFTGAFWTLIERTSTWNLNYSAPVALLGSIMKLVEAVDEELSLKLCAYAVAVSHIRV